MYRSLENVSRVLLIPIQDLQDTYFNQDVVGRFVIYKVKVIFNLPTLVRANFIVVFDNFLIINWVFVMYVFVEKLNHITFLQNFNRLTYRKKIQ